MSTAEEEVGTTHAGLTIPERTIVNLGSAAGKYCEVSLSEVQELLTKINEKQNPLDFKRPLKDLHIDFLKGQMSGYFTNPDGRDAETYLVSETGAQQLAKEVLPGKFFTGLKHLLHISPKGETVAAEAWNEFATKKTDVRLIRTVNMKLNGQTQKVIRSCHSKSYGVYSNLEFVTDLVQHAGDLALLPVANVRITDGTMRIRFVQLDATDRLALLSGDDPAMYRPMHMIEAWNSEVGLKKVGLRAGLMRVACMNSVCHWSEKTEFNWIHRGSSDRIKIAVGSAFGGLVASADEVVTAYLQAKEIDIADPEAWLRTKLEKAEVADRIIIKCQKALTDPTTTPDRKLASVIDAITLAAQSEEILVQDDLERTAAKLMYAGLTDTTEGA